jgi:hypothetical protein
MKNKAVIVRDDDNNVYLKVDNVCFKIEEYTTCLSGKTTKLSKEFLIDLSGGK